MQFLIERYVFHEVHSVNGFLETGKEKPSGSLRWDNNFDNIQGQESKGPRQDMSHFSGWPPVPASSRAAEQGFPDPGPAEGSRSSTKMTAARVAPFPLQLLPRSGEHNIPGYDKGTWFSVL